MATTPYAQPKKPALPEYQELGALPTQQPQTQPQAPQQGQPPTQQPGGFWEGPAPAGTGGIKSPWGTNETPPATVPPRLPPEQPSQPPMQQPGVYSTDQAQQPQQPREPGQLPPEEPPGPQGHQPPEEPPGQPQLPPQPNQPNQPGQPIDPNQAMTQVQGAFQTRFGRQMNQQEINALAQALGYTGGPISQDMLNRAMQLIQQYNGSLGGQPGQPGQPPPGQPGQPGAPPGGGIDPNQALNQVNQAFQTRFGRAINPQEQAALAQALGYTGGNVTQAQIDQALQWISRYSGRLDDPWGPINPPQPLDAQWQQVLQQILGQQIGFNPNDPVFKGQADAFQRASQRDTSRKRAALAERAAARGEINAGGFDVDTERIINDQGLNEKAFEAQLAGQELNKQRDQIMRALELGAGRLSDQERNALADKLAQLDAAIRREGLSLQKLLGMRSLDLQQLGLSQNNQQFYDQLGANIGLNQAQLNQNALLSLLNGGR